MKPVMSVLPRLRLGSGLKSFFYNSTVTLVLTAGLLASAQVSAVQLVETGQSCAGVQNPNLSCGSNDIKINSVRQVGNAVDACVQNQMVTIDVELTTQLNASGRYDVLTWFGEQGQNPKGTTGTCYISSLPDDPESIFILDLESGADQCLDVNSSVEPVTQIYHDVTFLCVDNVSPVNPPDPKHPDAVVQGPDGKADVFALVTWFQNNSLVCGTDNSTPAGTFEPSVNPKCDVALLLDLDIEIVPDTTLALVKTVVNDNGGAATEGDFQARIDGSPVIWGVANVLDAGVHTASEDGAAGYAAGTWGGDCAADGSITLVEGLAHTCTITNDDIAPTLTLQKTVINDNGGSHVEDDFQARIDGIAVDWDVAEVLDAGQHVATEEGVPGYTASGWGGDCAADGTITLSPGQNAVCSITNDDASPGLTLQKIVINDDGGTAVVDDFQARIDGDAVDWDVVNAIDAGFHTISEDELTGYAPGAWGGDCAADGTITLEEGQGAVCTITNNDIAPTLTLQKTVVNDNGGTAVQGDFQASIGLQDVDWGVATVMSAGDYTAAESSLFGYAEGDWGGDCNADGSISLAVGDVATCTIENDDIQPLLTVTKVVINDDRGWRSVLDFPLFVNEVRVVSGAQMGFDAGEYLVSEISDLDYIGSISGDCAGDGSLTLAVGDVLSCTIVNDDIPVDIPEDVPVPATSIWALILLALSVFAVGAWYFRERSRRS